MASTEADTRASIIEGVRDQEPDRWREFYEIYKPMLLAYFRKQGLPEGDASDLVQEVFLKLLKKIQTYDRSRTRFRTWLFTVARHTLIDQARRRNSQKKALDGWVSQVLATREDEEERQRREFEYSHHRRILQFAFAEVRRRKSERVWACFELSVVHGRTGAQVAEELGLKTDAVYVNSWRVLQDVKELCRRYDEELKHDPDDRLP
ncbi:RNA polymerase sigma factor [Planctomyces sp. SH-PL62]|uniref:RNA polymerase sigma factor n=1 Tax=Planctomyces sp. SH-PL62 TaxID=1636152 RepID=UPI00078C077E|nr:sigma-70 family RNA polymerase sigma factor [Planctomyces sp. SH-PL62]AMV37780.1 RNA polymerase sigma factor YlaC [Planctomyces sp. SH-PL62]